MMLVDAGEERRADRCDHGVMEREGVMDGGDGWWRGANTEQATPPPSTVPPSHLPSKPTTMNRRVNYNNNIGN
eukprot:scaffold13199_cov63-Cyclotella_meneghiniana.AAC.3